MMAIADCEIHAGDIGTVFEIALKDCSVDPPVPVDLTGVTTIEIIFKKPLKGKLTKTGVVVNPPGTDGLINYTTIEGDLDVVGNWEIQVRVVFPTSTRSSDIDTFAVHPNIL